MVSYKSGPPVSRRARDLSDKMLAKKVQVILLCTTITYPFETFCIVLPFRFPATQYKPCLLNRDLLATKGSGPALASIVIDLRQLVPVPRECLRDEGEGGKVNSRVLGVLALRAGVGSSPIGGKCG